MTRSCRLTLVVMSLLFVGSASFAEEPTVDDYIEYNKAFLGKWKATIEEGDKVSSGTAEWKLGAGGKCFLMEITTEGHPAMQGLIGYNPRTKKMVMTINNSLGGGSVARCEMTDFAKGKKLDVGQIGTWETREFSPDGKMTTGTETFHCLDASPNRIVVVFGDRKREGKTLPDFKLTYERE